MEASGNGQFQLIEGGQAQLVNEGFTVRQGSLEQSNVNIAQSMTDLMVTQRAYSLNTRVLQSTDELLSITNRMTD
ncbi:flagellar basal body rod C-terminal domain-containing protein [Enterococcus alcedinis]|uniref:flagellar basal body rod C-terminal domain-containing protein n=1 Tax=Enterococcus alcedinis TaxID=1274384 RepID=UPI00361D4F63